jgi:serine/threonine-protein kinase
MKRIGRYSVRGLLGKGGMGRVYKVAHPVIARGFALKRLEPAEGLLRLLGADRLRALFADEIRRMAGLAHPHILEILDAEMDHARPFYVMDYHCNNLGQTIGETYRTEKPSRPLPVDRAVRYSLQVLDGLTRLHHAGIVHRDIKPFNILLTAHDQVKICDFGLSRLRGEKFGAPATLKVGSPFYAAPEQADDPDQADFTADLYATGVMLYRMLSGRLPEHPLRPISRWQPDLDRAWDKFLGRALAPDPAARFQRAAAMRDDLAARHARWQAQWEGTCGPLPETPPLENTPPETATASVRATPIKSGPRSQPMQWGLDTLWRPQTYRPPRFRQRSDGQTVEDPSTGLTWQRGGSPFALDWHQAGEFIAQLNRDGFGGRRDWRLPTIAELITLLQPNPTGSEHCLPPVFDRRPQRLWSCDRRAYTSAWYVDLDIGFVAWQDLSCQNAIKAVCSPASTPPRPPADPRT